MKRKIPALTAALAAVSLALLACGSASGPTAATPSPLNTNTITVGALPVGDYAPVFYAKARGLFDAEGLNVTVQPIQGGANAVPALLNGSMSIASVNWISYILALSERIPVRAVLPAAQGAPGFSGIVAMPASGLAKPADLVGKTIAVNNLKSISELSTRVSLKENGIDPTKVKFVEVALPDMQAGLTNKSFDAAWVVEPFLTKSKAAGAVVVLDPFAGQLNHLPIGGWATSEKFASENPRTLDKFTRAVAKATAALKDDATFRAFLPTYSGLPAALASKLTLPTPQTSLDAAALKKVAGFMQAFGWIGSNVDVTGSLKYLHSAG